MVAVLQSHNPLYVPSLQLACSHMDVLANIIRVFANSTRPFADIIRVFVKSTRVFANLVCKHLTNTYNELQRVAIMASGL